MQNYSTFRNLLKTDNLLLPGAESMELVLETLGAEIVDYERQDLCCGAALGYNAGKRDESLEILAEKLRWMQEAAPQAIVVACPSCLTQFDTGQVILRRRTPAVDTVPVYHLAELVAYALGADPTTSSSGRRGHVRRHMVSLAHAE